MPVITVDWFEGRTPQQKAQLAAKITDAFVEVAGTAREHVWIVFNDTKKSDWAMGGTMCG